MSALARPRAPLATAAGVVLAGLAALALLRPHLSPAAAPAVVSHAGHGTCAPVTAPDHSAHAGTSGVPGYAPVMVGPSQAQAMGLTTAPVETRTFTRSLRTVGVVALSETRTAHVHTKVRGWIEGIRANYVGGSVRAGEVLCWVFSPEVYAAELEYIAVLDRGQGPDLLGSAARRRLSLWDIPFEEVDRLERTRVPHRVFPVLAPRYGTVVARQAVLGRYIDPSTELYTLSDLSQLWVLADIYEADVPYVHVGDLARITVAGVPGPLEAPVTFLSPVLDEATRTRKARIELTGVPGALLPGAFASVELQLPVGEGLAVPESAVIRTGTRAIAFVVKGEHVEPRELTLGPLVGDSYLVQAGVAAGERVATGAQFLLDSESRLEASGGGGGHVH